MSASLLSLRDIAGARGERTLFSGLDLDLRPGDAALVTGPNGAGKSTLLRIAAGLLKPASGTVSARGSIALLSEASALDPERRLFDALMFWSRLDGALHPLSDVDAALEQVGLRPLAELPVRLLSTGQRRRAGLARVMASRATIWLLDEPANGLDLIAVTKLEALIADHRAAGGTALIATHLPLQVPKAVRLSLGLEEMAG